MTTAVPRPVRAVRVPEPTPHSRRSFCVAVAYTEADGGKLTAGIRHYVLASVSPAAAERLARRLFAADCPGVVPDDRTSLDRPGRCNPVPP